MAPGSHMDSNISARLKLESVSESEYDILTISNYINKKKENLNFRYKKKFGQNILYSTTDKDT